MEQTEEEGRRGRIERTFSTVQYSTKRIHPTRTLDLTHAACRHAASRRAGITHHESPLRSDRDLDPQVLGVAGGGSLPLSSLASRVGNIHDR